MFDWECLKRFLKASSMSIAGESDLFSTNHEHISYKNSDKFVTNILRAHTLDPSCQLIPADSFHHYLPRLIIIKPACPMSKGNNGPNI